LPKKALGYFAELDETFYVKFSGVTQIEIISTCTEHAQHHNDCLGPKNGRDFKKVKKKGKKYGLRKVFYRTFYQTKRRRL